MKTTNLPKKKPSTINTPIPEKKSMQFLITNPNLSTSIANMPNLVYTTCTQNIYL